MATEIRIRVRIGKPSDRCPYCNAKDPKPETHIAEGRCKA